MRIKGRFHQKTSRRVLLQFLVVLILSLLIVFMGVTLRFALEFYEYPLRGGLEPGEKIREFALYLLLWEGILALGISYVFYRLFRAYEDYRDHNEEFLRLLIQSLSHKFGNFLSAQKIILELLAENPSPELVSRLRESHRLMEADLRGMIQVLRAQLEEHSPGISRDLEGFIRELGRRLAVQLGPRRLHLSVKETPFPLSAELEFLLFFLLENAFRYSKEEIWVRGGRLGNRAYLLIMNDLASGPPRGTGLGLHLARRLAERLGLRLRVIERPGRFVVRLEKFSRKEEIFSGFSTIIPRKNRGRWYKILGRRKA